MREGDAAGSTGCIGWWASRNFDVEDIHPFCHPFSDNSTLLIFAEVSFSFHCKATYNISDFLLLSEVRNFMDFFKFEDQARIRVALTISGTMLTPGSPTTKVSC